MRPLVLAGILAAALLACRRPAPEAEPAPADAAPLSETLRSRNGLLAVHYPASFAAKASGDRVVVVSRPLPRGGDEAIAFVAVEEPISADVKEFARAANDAAAATLSGYRADRSGPATCSGAAGVEYTGTWGSGPRYRRRACYFLRGGHGYFFSFSVPEASFAAEEPILLRIREATELVR